MSSKFKVLSFALALVVALGFYGTIAKADVTGSFGVTIDYAPIDCENLVLWVDGQPVQFYDQPCEATVYKFDVQTDLNVNITISGLTMGIHSHAGTTGFEDIILSFATTLGALDISDEFVFAQPFAIAILPDGQPVYACIVDSGDNCVTYFVKKRVEASISLGGVTFSNLAIFEDTTFPSPIALKTPGQTYQTQSFGFGDVVRIEGQTPSGITVSGETGMCARPDDNLIKKHAWPYSVNPDCVGEEGVSKPPFLFDYEQLTISGIPLASNLLLDIEVFCDVIGGYDCAFTNTLTILGFPVFQFMQIEWGFNGLILGSGGTSFGNIVLVGASGPVTLIAVMDPGDFALLYFEADVSFTINPDTNPASLDVVYWVVPGLIGGFDATLSVVRAGLTLATTVSYAIDAAAGTFDFEGLDFALSAEAGIVTVDATMTIADGGTDPETAFMLGGGLSFTVTF